ncbi:serine/threonine protein kinase [Hyphococcus sp.]|uniref:serine/threonine protein kinase n=1 Tax=Hyphococcus sp. TaxID=2038636 RepID=UPI0035C71037
MTSADNDLEKRAIDLVETALSVDEHRREAFVADAAGDDALLRQRAMAMLRAGSDGHRSLKTGGGLADAMSEAMPDEIGGFKIEREIGRGGMGAVYLARRPGADFDHAVAIKVVRSATSERLLERLRFERRTLAQLKHSNIAQMYDGGETPAGEPYFVMEYASGAPLHIYLKEATPSLAARLDIFSDVCAAVAYAHKNLVIHRDLAPSNILITQDGHAKLIDFGIAQSLEEDNDGLASALTMTKGYGAPERKQGAPASTITDVYSLGVILRDMIEGLPAPRRSDLEAIAHKAAAAQPEERYPTVDALMADITAYREGRAVTAVEKGWVYPLSRFIGRRKFAVAIGGLAVIAVLASSVIMSALYVRANAAEERAQHRFDEVRELAGFMMFDIYDDVTELDGSLKVREKIVATSLDYLDAIGAAPEAPAALRIEIARGYQRFAEVAGSPGSVNLGRRAEASELLTKAAEQIDFVVTGSDASAEALRAHAKIHRALGTLEWTSKGNFEKARENFTAAESALSRLQKMPEARLEDRVLDGAVSLSLSQSLRFLGDYDGSIAAAQSGVAKLETLQETHPDDFDTLFNLAHAYIYLGEASTSKEVYAGALPVESLPHFDKGVDLLRSLASAEDAAPLTRAQYISGLLKRAYSACQIDDARAGGVEDLSTAEALTQSILANEPNNDLFNERLSYILYVKSECQNGLGDVEAAMATGERLLKRRQAQTAREPENPDYLEHLYRIEYLLANLSKQQGDWPAACAGFGRAEHAMKRVASLVDAPADYQKQNLRDLEEFLLECAAQDL